jgi:hypothetical protein
MNILRAARALLPVLCLFGAWLVVPKDASGQEPIVELTLLSQTAITSQDEPTLELRFSAVNTGTTTLEDLSIGFAIGSRVISRVLYEQSLDDGPGSTLIYSVAVPESDPLEPGQRRVFDVLLDLVTAVPEIASAVDSAVYPAQVDLRSQDVVQASMNTALIHLAREPERPMQLAWWTEVAGPIAFGPDGRLFDRSLEEAVAPGGSLGAQSAALARLAQARSLRADFDVVIEPSLLDQLDQMAAGYERADGSTVASDQAPATDAATVLASLQGTAAGSTVQISAMPFSGPLLPSLLSGGLAEDLQAQRTLGDATVEGILARAPVTAVERPPGGALDEASLDDLTARGVTAVLANADTVERIAQLNDFAPLPVANLALRSGASLDLVLPDPGIQALINDQELLDDPVLAAQAILGEVATIWREQPVPGPQPDGSETVRGVAVALPASLPAGIWGPLIGRLAGAPFLEASRAQDFVGSINPAQSATELTSPSQARFTRSYVEGIRGEQRDVAAYRSMLTTGSSEPDELDRDLLYAQAGQYLGSGEAVGRRWTDHVNAVTEAIFSGAQPVEPQAFTLTSTEGSVPLRMGDPGDTPLTIQIQLRSSQFEFPDGNEQTVTLTRPDQIVTFTVRAKTAGTQTIRVRTRAPSGRTLAERNLAVRTTTVNAIALVITAAAGLVLIALWSRRYLRRPRS